MEKNQREKKLEENRKRGIIGTIVVHILILALLFIPVFSHQIPPPEKEGVLVSFGQPNVGSGRDAPSTQNVQPVDKVQPVPSEQAVEKVVSKEEQNLEVPVKKQPRTIEKVLTSDNSKALAIEKQKREAAEAEARRNAELQAAKERAAAEKARKMEEYRQAKKQFGNIFGKGKGNTETPGNQGDPGGDPDASVLEGISTGSGVVGGGLGNRGVKYAPNIIDRSQKSGIVVLNICVDENGKVVSADYTQRGSTTTDRHLKQVATKYARQYQFTSSDIDKQCGTLTVDFKLR